LVCEQLEGRVLLALPDLVGLDARSFGSQDASYYFHVEEPAPSWGDNIHIDFIIDNKGASPAATTSFNVQLYFSSTLSITSADAQFIEITGFQVPSAGQITGVLSETLTLPAVDPLKGQTHYIGMVIDPENLVAESNEANNSNQGVGIDEAAVSITPPHALVTDSVATTSDRAVAFGSVVATGPVAGQTTSVNSTATQYVTLSNTAARSILTVPQNGVKLAKGTDFKIGTIISTRNTASSPIDPTAGDNYIAPAATENWQIPITFSPTVTGNVSDTLLITTDDPQNPTISVALSGTGTPRPNLSITDSVAPTNEKSVNLGRIALHGLGTPGTASVTLSNVGSGALTVAQNGLRLPAGPFTITSVTSSTRGSINLASGSNTIASGGTETWTIGLKFDPTVVGLFQVPLTVLDSDPNNSASPLPPTIITLIGTGQSTAFLAAQGVGAFGSAPSDGTGKQSVTRMFTITNAGGGPLTINRNGITLATGTQFRIVSITSSVQGPIDLSSQAVSLAGNSTESWAVAVQFDPSVVGTLVDTLRIASSDPIKPITSVALSGTSTNQPVLWANGSAANPGQVSFPATINDGAGGLSSLQTLCPCSQPHLAGPGSISRTPSRFSGRGQ
jgi:hypothetical protein